MTVEDAIRTLKIELTKARTDYYPDRRNALTMAIYALKTKRDNDFTICYNEGRMEDLGNDGKR